jgi:hypothetical protein
MRSRVVFFTFPEDARPNPDRMAVEFGVEIGEYRGVVRVPRRVFQHLLAETPTSERCVQAYHLHRTRLELIVERKVRRRRLTDDGNVKIIGRDYPRKAESEARLMPHPATRRAENPPSKRWISVRLQPRRTRLSYRVKRLL